MHVHDSHHAGNAYCNYPKQIVSGAVGTDIVAGNHWKQSSCQ